MQYLNAEHTLAVPCCEKVHYVNRKSAAPGRI